MEKNTSSKELPTYDKKEIEKCFHKFQSNILNNINDMTTLKNNLLNLSFEGKTELELMSSFSLKIYLKSLSTEKNATLKSWLEETLSQRNSYKEKLKNIIQINNFKGDPLDGGENGEGGWNNFFDKKEIKQLINLDIDKTFQEQNLFKELSIKEIEYNVLFLFTENNQTISYKEGMNNILAMLIYILYPYYIKNENENKNYSSEIFDKWVSDPINNIKDIYYFFHDEDELQSDLYYLMNNLMKLGVNKFYEEDKDKNENYLVKRCDNILDKIKLRNNNIYNHFIRNNIDYEKIFKKWIKYIFTKDINLKHCNTIWDIILANEIKNPSGELIYINYFCIAMIEIISDELLKKDNDSFEILFNYIPLENINNLIITAEKIKSNNNNNNKPNNIGNSENNKKASSSMFDFLYSTKRNNNNNNKTNKTVKTNKTPNLMFGGNYSNNNKKTDISSKPKTNVTNNQIQQQTQPKKIPMFGNINNNNEQKNNNNKKTAMKFDFVHTKAYIVSNEENVKMINEIKTLIDIYIDIFSNDDKMKIDFLIDKLSKEL